MCIIPDIQKGQRHFNDAALFLINSIIAFELLYLQFQSVYHIRRCPFVYVVIIFRLFVYLRTGNI